MSARKPSAEDGAVAGLRDASWFDCPNTTEPKMVHLFRDAWSSRCGIALNEDVTIHPNDVPASARCQRSGCRQGWKARPR